jgi:hypothetical protein
MLTSDQGREVLAYELVEARILAQADGALVRTRRRNRTIRAESGVLPPTTPAPMLGLARPSKAEQNRRFYGGEGFEPSIRLTTDDGFRDRAETL